MKNARLCLLLLAVLLFMIAGSAQNQPAHNAHQHSAAKPAPSASVPSKDFDVEGIGWTECACTAYGCPCRSNGHPDTAKHGCDAADFAFITKGHYGDVKLDGLKAVIVGDLIDTTPEKMYANVYFDEKTTPEQRAAFGEMFGYMFSNWGGPNSIVKTTKVVPIHFTESPDKMTYTLEIPGILTEKAVLKRDKAGNPANTVPAMDPWGNEIHYADNVVFKYNDASLKQAFDHSGRQANFKFFRTTRDMYTKKLLLIQHGDMSGTWTAEQKAMLAKMGKKAE
jgi:hypothetical protein